MSRNRSLTALLLATLILGVTVFMTVPGIEVAAAPATQVADCTAFGTGSMENLGSLDIPFACSVEQQVYFGVCEPGDVEFAYYGTFEMVFEDAVVASSDYSFQAQEPVQYVDVGWATALSGENLATLNSTNVTEVPQYLYIISPSWEQVALVVQERCAAVITTVPPATETVLFEQTFEGVMTGDLLVLEGAIDLLYPEVIFRARWPGSSGTLTVFPPSGGTVSEGDAGVSRTTGAGVDQWTVEQPEKGQWKLEFSADSDFNGETVVLGAYVTGAPLAEGESGGSIRGLVFEDVNGNGQRDADEPGMAGVQVIISSPGDWQTTLVTSDDGTFAVVGLTRAYYSAKIVPPTGYVVSGPTRYEGIDIGYTGRLALNVNFSLTSAVVPSALPATGAGPGTPPAWPVLGLAIVVAAVLLARFRRVGR
jgi:hypothetical protein